MSILDGPIMPSIDTFRLERLKLGIQEHVGAHVLHDLEVERVEEMIFGGLIYRLKTSVLAEKLPPESVERSTKVWFDAPTSSWQLFKKEHEDSRWLGWLVRRRPVQYEREFKTATLTVRLERYRTFPQCNYVFPKDLGPFVNVAVTHDYWSVQ